VPTEGQHLRTGDAAGAAAVDLYWLPLGAGGHFVRLNGRAYEALMARIARRPAYDLYHSALQVQVPEATFVVEQTPVPDLSAARRKFCRVEGVAAGLTNVMAWDASRQRSSLTSRLGLSLSGALAV
jgi:hypothetical protein